MERRSFGVLGGVANTPAPTLPHSTTPTLRMTLLFALVAVLTLTGAVAAMRLRNLVHCALWLVAAFGGMDNIRRAYRHAVEQRYRFFSYGDAMLIEKR